MGSLSLLQGIFPTQGSALQADSLPADPQGKLSFAYILSQTRVCADVPDPEANTTWYILRLSDFAHL